MRAMGPCVHLILRAYETPHVSSTRANNNIHHIRMGACEGKGEKSGEWKPNKSVHA